MNTYQKQYAIAKAAADMARQHCNETMSHHNHLLDTGNDADFDRYFEIESVVRESCAIRKLEDAELAAEDALLDWCYKTMMKLHPEHSETFALTLAPGSKGRKYLNHRADMIDTAFRLAA